ncbi:hypothetical protein [Lutibacter flavus]|uniref:Curlin associated repeat-containing protein n=1 Tax=Lutibacter flavus TaxID=691689 RepID=A0A238ZMJ4_9FLAO|nr:hypothetical protein [Lutibacter flavus]SNR84349.1 Curlin associated repeat-containing protein [Lutibacter flavus]
MKKVVLGIAMLCATSMLFAQNHYYGHNPMPDVVNENPAPDSAPCDDCRVDQVTRLVFWSDSRNVSDVHQTGNMNDANVLQSGTGNYSQVEQDGSNGFFGGYNNIADIYQSGSSNTSFVKQLGDNNAGVVIQMGAGNYADQIVGVGFAENNDAYVYQKGRGNASHQEQYYDNNEARVSQTGRRGYNNAIQAQNSGADGADGSFASIDQNGFRNNANQTQIGSLNYAVTEQDGRGNKSSETQNAGSYAPGLFASTNISYVSQMGRGNSNCLTQTEGGTGWNYNWVSQSGGFNKATVNQSAVTTGNYSFIDQMGRGNNACIEQVN